MTAGSDYVATLPGAPFSDGKIFDPLGLADGAEVGDIKLWREAEIKHGRVAMLASLGVLVAEEYHPFFMGPDYIGPAVDHFQEISARFPEMRPSPAWASLHALGGDLPALAPSPSPRRPRPVSYTLTHARPRSTPPQFWVFSLLALALIEYNTITKAYAEPSFVTGEGGLRDEYSPGDLGFDPLNLKPTDQTALETMQTKELNNGRLAMIGIAGMLVQELVNPTNILDFLH